MDDSSCQGTISKSNPVILNYYRQFLLKGFDWQYFKILSNLDDLSGGGLTMQGTLVIMGTRYAWNIENKGDQACLER